MATLPSDYLTLIQTFAPLFFNSIWVLAQVLLTGAILTTGSRTVTAVLRIGIPLNFAQKLQVRYVECAHNEPVSVVHSQAEAREASLRGAIVASRQITDRASLTL